VLNHFAAHIDAKPLLINMEFIMIENISERQTALY